MQVTRVAPGWPVPSLMHRRRVMADRITYVGLDVHKDSIVVAVAAGGLRGEGREYGRIADTSTAPDRWLRKLGGDGMRLRFCYEAGPCGYGIQRRLSTRGHECVVVAPSLIPKRAGDRAKTERRGAAGRAPACPRCPARAVRASSSPGSCCVRDATMASRPGPGCIAGGWPGSSSSRRSITSCWKITLAVEGAGGRRNRLTAQIEAMLPDWTLAPVVAALQTMRGMALVNAATLIAELGDLSR